MFFTLKIQVLVPWILRVLKFFHFLDDVQRKSERSYKYDVSTFLLDSHNTNRATHYYIWSVTCAQGRPRGRVVKDATLTPNSNPEPVEPQPPATQHYYLCMRIDSHAHTTGQNSLNVLPKI
jgi:hypothetical protein